MNISIFKASGLDLLEIIPYKTKDKIIAYVIVSNYLLMVDVIKKDVLFIIANRSICGLVRESENELKIYIN